MTLRCLLLPAMAALNACTSSDTVTGFDFVVDPTPVPVTFTTTSIQMPAGLALHVHVTGTDSKGAYGGGLNFDAAGALISKPVNLDGNNQDWIVFAVAPGSGKAEVKPTSSDDNGSFFIPYTVTP